MSINSTNTVNKPHTSINSTNTVNKPHMSINSTNTVNKPHMSINSTDTVNKPHKSINSTNTVNKPHMSINSTNTVNKPHMNINSTNKLSTSTAQPTSQIKTKKHTSRRQVFIMNIFIYHNKHKKENWIKLRYIETRNPVLLCFVWINSTSVMVGMSCMLTIAKYHKLIYDKHTQNKREKNNNNKQNWHNIMMSLINANVKNGLVNKAVITWSLFHSVISFV